MELHLDSLSDQTVLVLGLGQSGLAMARWCARAGARVRVADTRAQPPGLADLRAECPAAEFIAGPFDASLLAGVQRVLRSPGLSPAEIAPVLVAAEQANTRVDGEITLFTEALASLRARAGYAPAVLAVTGTNGKTTVTALTGRLVERAGRTVAVAGNIGPTLLDTLSARLDAGDLPAVWVLELSSFQLHGVEGFEPSAATVLNISQDHLDWHGSLDAYAADKARIFGREALMVLNRDDPRVMAMAAAPTPASGAAGKGRGARPQPRAQVSFGAGLPQRPGDWGIETVGGMDWLVRALPADETRRRRTDAEDDLHIQRLMPADALRIAGRHNALNALAALALATAAGCPLAPMLHGLREYRGEPHRVESVAVVQDVEFIDDSKGTNVGATVAALQGLGVGGRRLVVILGGDGKGQDFSPLAPAVTAHARAVLLIGRDGPRIGEALAGCGVPLESASDMDAAVQRAARLARAGDAVLMSPACASLDMFRNYAHRAEVFRAAVARLALEAGVTLEGAA